MVMTVKSDSFGEELNVEFKATIHMEMSAFQKLAKSRFKGKYWLSDEPSYWLIEEPTEESLS